MVGMMVDGELIAVLGMGTSVVIDYPIIMAIENPVALGKIGSIELTRPGCGWPTDRRAVRNKWLRRYRKMRGTRWRNGTGRNSRTRAQVQPSERRRRRATAARSSGSAGPGTTTLAISRPLHGRPGKNDVHSIPFGAPLLQRWQCAAIAKTGLERIGPHRAKADGSDRDARQSV